MRLAWIGRCGGGVVREKWMGFRDIYEQNVQDLVVDWQWHKEELADVTPRFLACLLLTKTGKTLQEGQVWGR